MLLTTTSSIEGKVPSVYLGVLGAEVIFGAWFWKDIGAEVTDFLGGRNRDYEKVFTDARTTAMAELEEQAVKRGANAVLNVRFDYSVLGKNNGMMMVAATGTAVVVRLTKEEQAHQAAQEEESAEIYHIEIDGKQRGPFSTIQLRELHAQGKIAGTAKATTETLPEGLEIELLLSKNARRL